MEADLGVVIYVGDNLGPNEVNAKGCKKGCCELIRAKQPIRIGLSTQMSDGPSRAGTPRTSYSWPG